MNYLIGNAVWCGAELDDFAFNTEGLTLLNYIPSVDEVIHYTKEYVCKYYLNATPEEVEVDITERYEYLENNSASSNLYTINIIIDGEVLIEDFYIMVTCVE